MGLVDDFERACRARQLLEHAYDELAAVANAAAMQGLEPRDLHEAMSRARRVATNAVREIEKTTDHVEVYTGP